MVTVFNLGSIKHLTIPSEWSAQPVEHNRNNGSVSQSYTLASDEEVTFLLYYRGKEVSASVAEDFLAVLAKPPHRLTEDEYLSIEVVIRNMSEDDFFQRDNVETISLNGRTVLMADGLWKVSGVRNYGIFLPGNEKGTIIDELHFCAPAEKYDEHLAAAQEIYKSIKFMQGERQTR